MLSLSQNQNSKTRKNYYIFFFLVVVAPLPPQLITCAFVFNSLQFLFFLFYFFVFFFLRSFVCLFVCFVVVCRSRYSSFFCLCFVPISSPVIVLFCFVLHSTSVFALVLGCFYSAKLKTNSFTDKVVRLHTGGFRHRYRSVFLLYFFFFLLLFLLLLANRRSSSSSFASRLILSPFSIFHLSSFFFFCVCVCVCVCCSHHLIFLHSFVYLCTLLERERFFSFLLVSVFHSFFYT